MDVPEIVSDWPPAMKPVPLGVIQPPLVQVMPVCADVIFSPGAAISGLSAAGDPSRGPRDENDARVSAAVAAPSVPFTPPPSCALIVLPSASEMKTDGIVTAGPGGAVPPISVRFGSPTALLTTMAPMAPAA